ncbi:MAG: hypothetical protein RLZZ501_2510 [Pseudomonadota bacterium]
MSRAAALAQARSVLGRLARAGADRLRGLPRRRWPLAAAGAAVLIILLVFPVAMVAISRIDDNADFVAPHPLPGRLHAPAVVAALITRELEVNHWRANDPLFLPGGWLRDMPAFQLGLVGALARFTGALVVENGAGWTANGPDVALNHAAGLLKYPGTVWKFDTRTSWLPTASAEKQYRNAQRSIDVFNQNFAEGTVPFERSAATLVPVVEGLIRDLDDSLDAIDHHLAEERPVLLDFAINGVFYRNKGRLYADSIVMREVAGDFETVLAQRHLGPAWTKMVAALAAAARPKPTLLWGAPAESSLLPNHLLAQGYYAAQARFQAMAILAALKTTE